VKLDAKALKEALKVAGATMERVAKNADLVAKRLCGLEWTALSGSLRHKPAPAADGKVAKAIEKITGSPLPPSVSAFWEVVGGIDFVWNYKEGDAPSLLGVDLPIEELDPLCIAPARRCAFLVDEWNDAHDPEFGDDWDDADDDGFRLDLAPDALHKANISGGAPYGMVLPFDGVDPPFAGEPHQLPFVDYLRLCFRFGGFPGLEKHRKRRDVSRLIEHLTEGLLTF
jgi:hypothetical protein